MIVEVCANSLQSALNAQRAGADRIEFCSELGVGGITPSYGLLQLIRETISIPIHVLIRPRSGDFTYSDPEFEAMCRDITLCREMGFEGVVAGILQKNLEPDLERTRKLLALRGEMHFTFHRAFDWIPRPREAILQLEEIGVDTVLSSGQAKSALLGISLLDEMQQLVSHCVLMPGSGIRVTNVDAFKELGFQAVHLSAATLVPHLGSLPPLPMNSLALLSDSELVLSSEAEIRAVVESVK